MIYYFIFLIYRYPKSLLVLNCGWTTIYLLLTLSKVGVYHIGLVVMIIVECPWLRKIWWALGLMYQSSVHLLEVVLILMHHTWYLSTHTVTFGCILESRVKSMHSHSLLGFRGARSILLHLTLLLLMLVHCLLLILGITL